MYHIVYLTTNLVNQKIYVGVHSTYNLEDGYLGTGNGIKNAIKKHGKQKFIRQILYYCLTDIDAYEIESQIVDISFIKRMDVYNNITGGQISSIGRQVSDETRKRLAYPKSDSHKNKLREIALNRPEEIKKSFTNKNSERTAEWNYNNSQSKIGKHHSDETKQKMSITAKNLHKEIGYKKSIALTGMKHTEERKANQRLAKNKDMKHLLSVMIAYKIFITFL